MVRRLCREDHHTVVHMRRGALHRTEEVHYILVMDLEESLSELVRHLMLCFEYGCQIQNGEHFKFLATLGLFVRNPLDADIAVISLAVEHVVSVRPGLHALDRALLCFRPDHVVRCPLSVVSLILVFWLKTRVLMALILTGLFLGAYSRKKASRHRHESPNRATATA